MHRLHATSGAEVEDGADGYGRGGPQQRQRRLAYPEHVVAIEGAGPNLVVEVGEDPSGSGTGVERPQIEAGADLGAGALEQAGPTARSTSSGASAEATSCRAVVAEQEQSERDADRPRSAGRAAHGHRFGAAERRVRRATEKIEQGVGLIADSRECATQVAGQIGQRVRGHAPARKVLR